MGPPVKLQWGALFKVDAQGRIVPLRNIGFGPNLRFSKGVVSDLFSPVTDAARKAELQRYQVEAHIINENGTEWTVIERWIAPVKDQPG